MTFLPIAGRELQVAARRRATYWNRSAAVLLGCAIIFWLQVTQANFLGPAQAGATLFAALSRVTFFCCLFAGVFLTADCLSHEKRDGTLGLLFLTDLKGYDVVLGKLFASSVNAVFAVLATFPMLAVPLLMGGVTLVDIGLTMMALANALFFSLTMGLFISAVSWKEQKAMLAAAAALFLIATILPALGGPFAWLSPSLAFDQAVSPSAAFRPWHFWGSMAVVQGLSWGLLALASRKVIGSWELKMKIPSVDAQAEGLAQPALPNPQTPASGESPPLHTEPVRHGHEPVLDGDPIEWLAARNRSRALIWCSLGVLTAGWVALCASGGGSALVLESFLTMLTLHFVVKFWIAWEACHRFYEERQTGTLETLLSTPLGVGDIVRSQMKSLHNQFVAPVCTILMVDVILLSWAASNPALRSMVSHALLLFGAMLGLLVADAYALAWLGLWLGLRARRSWTASFSALAWVVMLPTSVFTVLALLLGSGRGGGPDPTGGWLVLWIFIGGVNSWIFGASACRKLHTSLREAASLGAGALLVPRTEEVATPLPPEPELGEYYSLLGD